MIDSNGYKNIDKSAKATRDAVNNGEWLKATTLWSNTENVILQVADNIDFYNILTKLSPSNLRSRNLGKKSPIHIDKGNYIFSIICIYIMIFFDRFKNKKKKNSNF